jgi:hypothetical protein
LSSSGEGVGVGGRSGCCFLRFLRATARAGLRELCCVRDPPGVFAERGLEGFDPGDFGRYDGFEDERFRTCEIDPCCSGLRFERLDRLRIDRKSSSRGRFFRHCSSRMAGSVSIELARLGVLGCLSWVEENSWLVGVVAGHGEVVELEKWSGRYSLGIT